MAAITTGRIRPHGCRRCGGAAYFNASDGEWACLLCARPVRLSISARRTASRRAA